MKTLSDIPLDFSCGLFQLTIPLDFSCGLFLWTIPVDYVDGWAYHVWFCPKDKATSRKVTQRTTKWSDHSHSALYHEWFEISSNVSMNLNLLTYSHFLFSCFPSCWLFLLTILADYSCRLFLLTISADYFCWLFLLTIPVDYFWTMHERKGYMYRHT